MVTPSISRYLKKGAKDPWEFVGSVDTSKWPNSMAYKSRFTNLLSGG